MNSSSRRPPGRDGIQEGPADAADAADGDVEEGDDKDGPLTGAPAEWSSALTAEMKITGGESGMS